MRLLMAALAFAASPFFCAGASASVTELSGVVAVKKTIVVKNGDTLRALPGTKLMFGEGAGIVVEGVFEAEGKAGRPVRFSPAKKGVRWDGITVASSGSFSIDHATVEGCREAVILAGGRMTARSVVLKDCEKGIVVMKMAEADIRGLRAERVAKTAVAVRQDSKAALDGCVFENGGTGLSVTGRCDVTVSGSTFKGLASGISASFPGASPEVTGCSFTGNKYGVSAEYPEARPSLVSSTFTGNTYGVYSKRMSAPELDGCDITGNEYAVYATEGSSLAAAGCRITGNRYGVYVTFSSYPKVNGCDLSGNSGFAAYLDEQSYEWVSASGDETRRQQMGMRAVAAGNRGAEARRKGADAARYVNPKKGFVDFQGNYWGEQAAREMRASSELAQVSAIYDYFDKNTDVYDGKTYVRDRVDYSGWLAGSPKH